MAVVETDQSDSHPPGARWAALDCGTNTVLLSVVSVGDGALRPLLERVEITRLGQGLAASGQLAEEAIGRTEAALGRHAQAIRGLGCARVLAVGTEALRRARNGEHARRRFDEILRPLGAQLEIIDGRREGSLAFLAARHRFPELTGPRTVVDIGGGSTELVVGDTSVTEVVSLPIGSVVLTERCVHGDPPPPAQLAALERAIDDALADAPALPPTVIALAATATTLASLATGSEADDLAAVEGATVDRAWLERELPRLAAMPLAERRRLRGLKAERADLIIAGGYLLLGVLRRAGASGCVVSDRGVRWGLLHEAAQGTLRP